MSDFSATLARSLTVAVLVIAGCSAGQIQPTSSTLGARQTSGGSTGMGTGGSTSTGTTTRGTGGTGGTNTGGTGGSSTGGTTGPAATTFAQGLFRGQDSRISHYNGYYYYVGFVGQTLEIFKSKSMVDQGVGKALPAGMNGTLFAPVFIGSLGGVTYNAWYIFGPSIWTCVCTDPYDNADQWTSAIANVPYTANGFDFEVFQNPQPGAYQNHWYLLWVASVPGGYAENIYAAEILSLTPGQTNLSSYSDVPTSTANLIVPNRGSGTWTDIIVEAPGMAINGTSVTMAYSGNGTQTTDYAVGYSILKMGADPTQAASWMDYSNGGCDGDVHNGPEFAQNGNVWGPGVARFSKSADNMQDWLMFASKVWNTFDAAAGTPEQQQTHNEEYTRYLSLQPFTWKQVTCSGATYSIPDLGTPQAPGFVQNLPSGDPGVTAKTANFRIEGEHMIPFGDVMGTAVQSLPTSNTVVLSPTGSTYSCQTITTNFDDLAAGETTATKTSGLTLRNTPPGSGLVVASASVAAASFDLYINGKLVQTLNLPATGSATTVMTTQFSLTIPANAQLDLVYQAGKNQAGSIDYIEIMP